VTDPLDEFLGSLVPPHYDRATASRRRERIQKLLSSSSVSADYMFESGSWSHGTAIAAKSDVDYMVWCHGSRPAVPSGALATLHRTIDNTDGVDVYKVRTRTPVVSVEFFTGPHFEIVPAYSKSSVGGVNVFWIPGRGDEWVLSAPEAHLAYVNKQNDRLGKKVKPLVRLMKAWKHHTKAPVSSFYLEMRVAEYAARETTIIYDIDLPALFRRIIGAGAKDMNDPEGLVGRIPACASEEKRRQTLALMRDTDEHLDRSHEARTRHDKDAYWSNMCDVFGSDFPWPSW
jgi:Second Messenger Oligonucleotide or Dinucleotide Synthetase domain